MFLYIYVLRWRSAIWIWYYTMSFDTPMTQHSESLNHFTKRTIINGKSAAKLLNLVVTLFLEYMYEIWYDNRRTKIQMQRAAFLLFTIEGPLSIAWIDWFLILGGRGLYWTSRFVSREHLWVVILMPKTLVKAPLALNHGLHLEKC